MSRAREMSFSVRSTRSARPFCDDVYGQDIRSWMPSEAKNERGSVVELAAVVTWESEYVEVEVAANKRMEVFDCVEHV